MSQTTQQTGRYGEAIAQRHLQGEGYAIVETNWRCVYGEIDIIAQDGEVYVFVEVRTRQGNRTAPAFESITPNKRQKMIRAAYAYAETLANDTLWRIDVIAVALPAHQAPVIAHMENALDWL
jgi:putative endonuclease